MSDLKTYMVVSPVSYGSNIVKEGTIDLPDDVAERLLDLPEPPIALPDIEELPADDQQLDSTDLPDNDEGVTTATTDGSGDKDGSDSNAAPITLEDIVEVIEGLDPKNEAHFTKGLKPHANVLSDVLDHNVSAAERDEAWAVFQERQKDQETK